ncbi:isoprenylcysteine carboxylmethyltransferase family protein [Arthrobacter sp. SDTb3-6]|uniref:methyltransferase family protein n=1 Tax=Arthrobacter sp. SDTb3-6 TaxID=2713571 RepID=UPI00159E9A34|nr:isoprenylcysteine carboxylmethyltransferase family protein [Arthrobacter sp. SDTb3-6]
MERQSSAAPHRGPSPAWLAAAYVVLGGFMVLERFARKRGRASSLDPSAEDRGTTRMIVGGFMVAGVLPLLLRPVRQRPLPRSAGALGLALEAAGLCLRLWSMRTLGGSYTRTLQTNENQQVVDTGPYRVIRHPGYLGSLLAWTGCAVASGSVPTVLSVAGLLAAAYRRRIGVEEELLRRKLPGYAEYAGRTKKLVPLLW